MQRSDEVVKYAYIERKTIILSLSREEESAQHRQQQKATSQQVIYIHRGEKYRDRQREGSNQRCIHDSVVILCPSFTAISLPEDNLRARAYRWGSYRERENISSRDNDSRTAGLSLEVYIYTQLSRRVKVRAKNTEREIYTLLRARMVHANERASI